MQIIGEVLLEVAVQELSPTRWEWEIPSAALAVATYVGLGFILGWLSILIFPHSFIRSSRLHGISLIITPLLAGLTMSGIGWIRR